MLLHEINYDDEMAADFIWPVLQILIQMNGCITDKIGPVRFDPYVKAQKIIQITSFLKNGKLTNCGSEIL